MLKRISASQVILGMYLHKIEGAWIEHSFWRNHFLLERPEDLQRLQASQVQDVWIDTLKGCDVAPVVPATLKPAPAPAKQPAVAPRHEMKAEVARAVKLCGTAKRAVITMFEDLRMGKAVEPTQVVQLVDAISESLLRHPHALISLARLKIADEYTYMHSVAVCGLMIALARQLGLAPPMIQEAGLAVVPRCWQDGDFRSDPE